MNQILLEFYSAEGPGSQGRTLNQMLNMTDDELEKSHTVVQWLFPLNEPSNHNRYAPLLDDETIAAFKNSEQCWFNLDAAGTRFLRFLAPEGVERPHWINPWDHNLLRVTRIIKCYRLTGYSEWAERFYQMAMNFAEKFPEGIGKDSLKFWKEAYELSN